MEWHAKSLFEAIESKPHAEHDEALARAAADGCLDEVIAEVRRLLQIKTAEAHTVASPHLQTVRAATGQVAFAPGERPGDWIGPYKLLESIGEGGFGVVWLAERREPMVQRVALKII
ncbi:MAG: hypothetical protein ACOYN0_19890, partial [Phycisphaerales bacterium]